jgi:hypothetical protein
MNDTVESCPGNATAVAEASTRLGCGRDENGNDQYICVPNDSKTALKEFCHNGFISPVLGGEWLIVNYTGDICICTGLPLPVHQNTHFCPEDNC